MAVFCTSTDSCQCTCVVSLLFARCYIILYIMFCTVLVEWWWYLVMMSVDVLYVLFVFLLCCWAELPWRMEVMYVACTYCISMRWRMMARLAKQWLGLGIQYRISYTYTSVCLFLKNLTKDNVCRLLPLACLKFYLQADINTFFVKPLCVVGGGQTDYFLLVKNRRKWREEFESPLQ